eukprot:TRINITY_DN3552_c0_g1_i16.p1 TRINITY_DN3552_c0_g1~~TRINITY_DN3552_c0_g1_i16.p1  ORF type:complete len:235 (+),score=39.75 TRINITY_DN3552_c0_g1_i16:98-802(+)
MIDADLKLDLSDARWEELKRQARKVEGTIYSKLSDYAKLSSPSTTPSPNGESQLKKSEALEAEIESSLAKLAEINNDMHRFILSNPTQDKESLTHTLNRYRSVHVDFSKEYKKTKTAVQTYVYRAELLGTGSKDRNALRSRTEMLLKEKSSIQKTLQMTDDVIEQAQNSRAALMDQRRLFGRISDRMATLGEKFPAVNQVVQRIRNSKEKDMIVMALVITSCFIFTIVYWFNKS